MLIFLMTFLSVFFQSPSEHEKINNRFSRQLSKNLHSYWGLNGGWCGGKLNPTLDIVRFNYDLNQSLDKDEIRKVYVDVMEYMLHMYNTNGKLRGSLGEFPFRNKNIQIIIHLIPNENKLGKISSVKGFQDKVIFTYVTDDMSYVRDEETFEEAYFKVYGREWDPFKYECEKG